MNEKTFLSQMETFGDQQMITFSSVFPNPRFDMQILEYFIANRGKYFAAQGVFWIEFSSCLVELRRLCRRMFESGCGSVKIEIRVTAEKVGFEKESDGNGGGK